MARIKMWRSKSNTRKAKLSVGCRRHVAMTRLIKCNTGYIKIQNFTVEKQQKLDIDILSS